MAWRARFLANLALCLQVPLAGADTPAPDPRFLEFLGTFNGDEQADVVDEAFEFIDSLPPGQPAPDPPPAPAVPVQTPKHETR